MTDHSVDERRGGVLDEGELLTGVTFLATFGSVTFGTLHIVHASGTSGNAFGSRVKDRTVLVTRALLTDVTWAVNTIGCGTSNTGRDALIVSREVFAWGT